jgi:hypothetical protein
MIFNVGFPLLPIKIGALIATTSRITEEVQAQDIF